MERVLLVTVRFHDGRYHGAGDWPPSPARLFQALVAGIGQDGPLSDDASKPLEWLEELDPPVIAAPQMTPGMTIPMHFVPNNDLDAFGGLAANLPKTRTDFKVWKPRLFDQTAAFHYAWRFDETDSSLTHAQHICDYAERLYQFGRGIDQAWAIGEIIEPQKLDEVLLAYQGVLYRPTGGRYGTVLARPQKGSLQSLKVRYKTMSRRFTPRGQGGSIKLQFAKAPEARFTPTAYDSPPSRQVFELGRNANDGLFAVWQLAQASRLVVSLRDGAVTRLRDAFPDRSSEIEQFLVGRKANGADDGPASFRVRIIPLPSIGHHHADRGIRRVLVEIPAECPLRADDVHWAFSGLDPADPETGEVLELTVTPTEDESMLSHFGIGGRASRVWRTVTPVALPESASRRRIDPVHRAAQAKDGTERAAEQAGAAGAVIQALHFAGIRAWADLIRVQREPFEGNGERVEAFAPGTRFAKQRLWHVEITFRDPITGPLVIGDGRFLGLGVMAPCPTLRS